MNKKKEFPTLKEFAKRAKCKDCMAAGFYYAVFKSRNISMNNFFGGIDEKFKTKR